jgi:hypothetical protein
MVSPTGDFADSISSYNLRNLWSGIVAPTIHGLSGRTWILSLVAQLISPALLHGRLKLVGERVFGVVDPYLLPAQRATCEHAEDEDSRLHTIEDDECNTKRVCHAGEAVNELISKQQESEVVNSNRGIESAPNMLASFVFRMRHLGMAI